jgi:hypothetical protein
LLGRVGIRHRTQTGPPDFVGVGTVNSGSRWWLRFLLEHPAIESRRRRDRELRFFDEFCTREMTRGDVASYHSRFPRKAGRIAGEWTPLYMSEPWTPLLLHRAAPEAKLLALVRDPVERYRARLAQRLSEAQPDEEVKYMSDATSRGRYASQLRGLLAFYDAERILVLQYEQCRTDPLRQYARTLRFLAVSDDFQPKRLQALAPDEVPYPYSGARRLLGRMKRRLRGRRPDELAAVDLWPDLRRSLLVELEPEVLELQTMVPDLRLELWPNFAHLAAEHAARHGGDSASAQSASPTST